METIAVIGSNMVDLVTYVTRMPMRGETLEAPGFELGCGGKGANQAVAAARLGARVVMVTKVGDDVFADNTIRNFAHAGIDTEHVRKVPGVPSGVAPIFVEPDSSNSILIVKGANRHLKPADIDAAAPKLRECALIVLQLEIELDTVYHAIAFGARHGIPVLLNPAPAVPDLDFERIRPVEFFVPNETELAIVSGMPVDSPETAARAAASLVERGLRQVIVTLGDKGSLLVSHDGVRHVPGVSVDARDTTGAGDAYIGCFARYYVESRDAAAAMRYASAYAAHSVTGLGTQKSYADAATFEHFMRDAEL
ncbi:ribokinase [Burkholderia ubonensis]|uniref:ribokinase n=1 Tax=Burkholderia ubonensis TaxID=101571 RepID=UPI000BA62B7D|nr:ribokinase [Burkholderia ubonensis]PAK13362.1 ribokinase [Burkholderia ubonensis]RQP29192.1 ribokinase [Burkholderia ubonensis]RQP31990.1 ribokinase [Burkholderia ubonensis]RQP34395.1 ribokinase [Burkholderia ubonensis]RQP49527.1 ribokinase [Burkholderia ubonensis]